MSNSQSPSVIQLGLPVDYHKFDQKSKDWLAPLLEKGEKKMKEAGIQYAQVDVTPEEGVEPVVKYLKEHKVDAVVIGAGIRRDMDLTYFMEQLIETAKTHAPHCKILFNTGPDTALEATQRWFPGVKGAAQSEA